MHDFTSHTNEPMVLIFTEGGQRLLRSLSRARRRCVRAWHPGALSTAPATTAAKSVGPHARQVLIVSAAATRRRGRGTAGRAHIVAICRGLLGQAAAKPRSKSPAPVRPRRVSTATLKFEVASQGEDPHGRVLGGRTPHRSIRIGGTRRLANRGSSRKQRPGPPNILDHTPCWKQHPGRGGPTGRPTRRRTLTRRARGSQ